MEIIALCGIYIAELLCNSLSFLLLFHEKIRIKPVVAFGMLMPVVIGLMPVGESGRDVLISVWVIIIMISQANGKWSERGAKVMLAWVFIIVMNDVIKPVSQHFFNSIRVPRNYTVNFWGEQICTIGLLFILYILSTKFTLKEKVHIQSYIFVIIAILSVLMMFCTAVLNHVKIVFRDKTFLLVCNVLNVMVHVSIVLLVICVIYIKNTNERMSQLLRTEKILKESQVCYYKQLLKKEESTRKYRHDMNNHLIYLQKKMKDGKYDEAEKYLEQILGGMNKINRTYYMVGNEMVEVILNYYLNQLPESIPVIIDGKCPVEFCMTEIDVCTIFSNIFQNITEELGDYQGENAKVIIHIKRGKEYVLYEIKNTIVHADISKAKITGYPQTGKQDKHNHGFGLENVQKAVEENEGKFEWKIEDGFFCISLILHIK